MNFFLFRLSIARALCTPYPRSSGVLEELYDSVRSGELLRDVYALQ